MCGSCCGEKGSIDEKALLSNPTKNRGCTDCLSLIIFILFWGGMIFIAAFSISKGDAFRLIYGYDSFGNTCDENNEGNAIPNISLSGLNMKGKSHVFFMDITRPTESMVICVNKCPDRDFKDLYDIYAFTERSGSYLCRYDIKIEDYQKQKQGVHGPCPVSPVKQSEPLLNRCVPSELMSLPVGIPREIISYLNDSDIFQRVLADLYSSWKEMLGLCFVAVGFAILMVLLIRFMASVIVWIIVAFTIIASIAGTAFLWWTYAGLKQKLDSETKLKIPLLAVDISSESAFLTFSIIATILTVILLLILLIMRKRFALVVALFHEAGTCVAAMPCLLLQPMWTFFILIVFFVYWVIILAYLSTAEIATVNKQTGFVKFEQHEQVSYFWWYHLIGLVWTSEFIIACQQLVVSGAVARWYFTREKDQVNCPICGSIGHLVIYHLGTVALGSLVITIVKLPRWILMYLNKQLKGSENQCARFCMKCCICCLWCLERCLKYLNANAYTIVAVSGKNFCTSAKKAFTMLVTNVLRVAAINSIGDFILFLGKLGVMAATAAFGIIWFKSRSDLHYFAIPVLLVCVFAYFIAHCFLSVYEMVIDALFLCLCEDLDLNDGSQERQYFGKKSLRSYIQDTSKELNKMRKKKGEGEAAEPAHL
ncbi:choline transporter-like protein 1 [Gigantopelta aegis]|uniref:choline transporter-like protein 1 n=1 Tax=Gigantopelta aegis TaxID=1735272 RepID=UPI001B88E3BD|nr:choline transporter-like protein 1 [Gigantopelta aegis]XP_041356727.1 choline transporter-like protein 1 [Gigantopelta aegis]XP_041356728.1 choline transporter-like protein 1 [Gigantopelta aegis]XP_041356729.1 choline transporter-like protein 1 [Gigantopelta aegis]